MNSLRSRLLLWVGLGQLLVLAGLNVGLWNLAKTLFTRDFDERIAVQALSIASLIDQEGPYVEFDYKQDLAPRFERDENPDTLHILVENVGILHATTELEKEYLPTEHGTPEKPVHWDGPLPDGREGRWVDFRYPIASYEREAEDGKTAERCTAVLTLATSRDPIDRDMASFRAGLLTLDLVIALASGLLVALGVRYGLHPVKELTESVEKLEAGHEVRPLASNSLPSELAPLADSVQALHHRLQLAIDRERRLSGHIAHELRTPISELRTMTEVALLDGQDPQGLREATEQSRDVAIEMENIVATLLRIWREEAAGAQGERGRVDVLALMRDLQSRVSGCALERSLTWSATGSGPVFALAESKPLELVLSNLIDNAVEHSPQGSQVLWHVIQTGDRVEIGIENPRHENALDNPNGTTKDPDSRHAGLGLSLSQRVSSITGFGFEVESSRDHWSVQVTLPAPTLSA